MDNSLGKFNRDLGGRHPRDLNEKRNVIEITRELYLDQNKKKISKEEIIKKQQEEIKRLEQEIAKLSEKHERKKEENLDAAKRLKDTLGATPSLGESEKEAEKFKREMEERRKRLSELDNNLSEEDLKLREQEMAEAGHKNTGERVESIPLEHEIASRAKEEEKFYPPVPKGFHPPVPKEFYPPAPKEFHPPAPVDKDKFYPPVPQEATYFPKEKIKMRAIDLSEIVKGAAWRQAEKKVHRLLHSPEEEMTSATRKKSVFNNVFAAFRHPVKFLKKSWVRMAEAGYTEKYYQDALKAITDNQNLMVELNESYRLGRPLSAKDPNLKRNEHYEILAKVLEEYSNNMAEMEERGNKITDPAVDARFQKLVYAYQKSCLEGKGWTREQFENVQRKYINRLKKMNLIRNEDFLGADDTSLGRKRDKSEAGGRMYATNLFDIAQDYKNHIESSLGMIAGENKLSADQKQRLRGHVNSNLELDIELGTKISDVMNRRPAGTFGHLDKFIGWMQSAKLPILGRIAANPGAAAIIGAAGSTFLSKVGLKLVAGTALAATGLVTGLWIPVVAGGVAAGVFGAMRRNRELKADRAMHQRQKTLGKEFKDFRRGNLDKFQYDVKSTADLDRDLDVIIGASGGSYNSLTDPQKQQLASVFARYKVELAHDRDFRVHDRDNKTVDLIAATKEEGEKYGTHYISKTNLKKKLYDFLKNNNLIDRNTTEPIDPNFDALAIVEMGRLNKNIEGADKSFDRYRKRSVATVGVLAGAAGALGVFGGRAAMAWAAEELGLGGKAEAMAGAVDRDKLRPEAAGAAPMLSFRGPEADADRVGELMSHLKPNSDGTIDSSGLPAGWSLVEKDGKFSLLHSFTEEARAGGMKPTSDWNEFAKGLNQDNSQRVSYQGFKYQGTPPDQGVRAMVENARNLANNLKLHVNDTELMMRFRDGGDGNVIVDASKMFGKELKAELASKGVKMEDYLAKGGKFYLALAADNSNAPDGSQFHPILLEMGRDGTIKVPKDMAKYFFQFKDGKLVQGPGYGLKQLVMDTGMKRERDGAMIVEGISARLGEKPSMEVPVIQEIPKTEEIILEISEEPQEELPVAQAPGTPWAIGPAWASRWQLESERKKKEEARQGKDKKRQKSAGDAARTSETARERETAETETREGEDRTETARKYREINKQRGEAAWKKMSGYFYDPKDIFGKSDLKKEEAEHLLADVRNVTREDSKNVFNGARNDNFPAQRKEIKRIYESFLKSFRIDGVALSLSEFTYCLNKGLTEYVKRQGVESRVAA